MANFLRQRGPSGLAGYHHVNAPGGQPVPHESQISAFADPLCALHRNKPADISAYALAHTRTHAHTFDCISITLGEHFILYENPPSWPFRSEERRVGKERGSGWAAWQQKQKDDSM